MRTVTCRLSPRSLGTKILIIAALAIWTLIGTLHDVAEREVVNYVDSPWSDGMDTKRYRPLPDRNVTYAKIQDDVESPEWTPKRLLQLLEESSSSCRKMTDLGGSYSCKDCQTCSVDGNKYICFDPDVRPHPGDCLIYSFGVGGEVSWDTAMVHLNCSVYAFDMTSKTWDNGMLIENLHFLALGLGPNNVDADIQMHNETHPNERDKKRSFFRTLETVKDFLGHNDRVIDVLKLDIEFAEWDFFESLFRSPEKSRILQDVRQIALEIHLDDLKHQSAAKRVRGGQRVEQILETLQSHGFHLVHTELNTAFQVFADVRGEVLPLFRESLYVRRP